MTVTHIPVKAYAATHHVTEESVISKLRDGRLNGYFQKDGWYVTVAASSSTGQKTNNADNPFLLLAIGAGIIFMWYKLTTCSFTPPLEFDSAENNSAYTSYGQGSTFSEEDIARLQWREAAAELASAGLKCGDNCFADPEYRAVQRKASVAMENLQLAEEKAKWAK